MIKDKHGETSTMVYPLPFPFPLQNMHMAVDTKS